VNTENEKVVRDSDEQEIVDAYKHLHKGKLGMHWLWAAILRMNAGESEQSVMNDFGYVLDIDAALQSQVSNTDGWVMVPVEVLDKFPELNTSNYNNDDVCELNAWGIELVLSAAPKAPQQVSNASTRDTDWVLAMAEALGTDSGYSVPIVPTAEAFRELFAAIRSTPPQQQEQSVEAVAPIGYIRLQNGKVDWDENCLSATEGGTLFGYEGKDGYTESPVYLESGQRVGSAALHTLLEYCERAEDCQMGTLAIDLVQRLVNEALSTTTPTATASQASREEQMVSLRTDESGNPTVWCDPEIADLVDALNTNKLSTVASCSGHGHRPGRISLKDGRELLVMNSEQVATVERLFGTDINGASQESAPGQEAVEPYATFVRIGRYGGGFRLVFHKEEPAENVDLFVAPPTSTAIAELAIKQAAEACEKVRQQSDNIKQSETCSAIKTLILALTSAAAEAELEALMMKVADNSFALGFSMRGGYLPDSFENDLRAIVRRVLDEKGE
jgi:hypothetical protein